MNFWRRSKTDIVQNEVKIYCLFTLLIFRRAINDFSYYCKEYPANRR